MLIGKSAYLNIERSEALSISQTAIEFSEPAINKHIIIVTFYHDFIY